MEKKAPYAQTTLECPVLKRPCDVNLEINIFRGADHGGVEATSCSEFLHEQSAPTCGKECIHSPEAHQAHGQAVRQHLEALSKIGPDVIG